MYTSTVTVLPPKKTTEGKPAHWKNKNATKFVNPWPSYRLYASMFRIVPYTTFVLTNPKYPKEGVVPLSPVRTPDWSLGRGEMSHKIKATWLGHASFLVEFPAKASEPRGVRVLFDPIMSMRCSASQSFGPKRYTRAPCKIEDIPEVDVIVISHNHYDHMDFDTLESLFKRPRKPLVFAPLGNEEFIKSTGATSDVIHIMDWWESKHVEIQIPHSTSPEGPSSTLTVDITCTPCQHFSGRVGLDDYNTLWCSWVVEAPTVLPVPSIALTPAPTTTAAMNDEAETSASAAVEPEGEPQRGETVKVYFAGDTGYRSVRYKAEEDTVPCCPAFKEIGECFGGFDFAMIPIGAYLPRRVMSPIHCAPQDSVRLFKDIRARKALGMHWGTWILTTEPVDEPPKLLREECTKLGISHRDFDVCEIGETRYF